MSPNAEVYGKVARVLVEEVTMESVQIPVTFGDFYLTQHSKPWTRRLHALGMLLCLVVAAALVLQRPLLWWLVPVAGYGPAWFSHLFIEHNKPATFRFPLCSLLSDFRMTYFVLTGKLHERSSQKPQS
jgi:hypothetical protein